MAILAGVGPMGLAAINYALRGRTGSFLLVITDTIRSPRPGSFVVHRGLCPFKGH